MARLPSRGSSPPPIGPANSAGDAATAEIQAAEGQLAARQKEVDAEKKDLASELAVVEAELAKALDARTTLIAGIDKRVVALFEQIGRAHV